ncbi:MAG: response regulator [Ilumatobacteraceae bacterium]
MQKPLVLVVDDDRRQAEFRAELLSQAGCTTVVCSSVQEAATTIGDLLRLDLVLTDLHLTRAGEDRSGLVVAHKARERFVGIPVVGLVPFGTSDLLDDGDRSGFSAVMEKGVRNLPELKVLTDQLAGLARNHLASKLRSRA